MIVKNLNGTTLLVITSFGQKFKPFKLRIRQVNTRWFDSDCLVVIFWGLYFLNAYALQSDNNSNRVYVFGHKYVLGSSQSSFNTRLAAWAKMSPSRAQNIFIPNNIKSVVLLQLILKSWHKPINEMDLQREIRIASTEKKKTSN